MFGVPKYLVVQLYGATIEKLIIMKSQLWYSQTTNFPTSRISDWATWLESLIPHHRVIEFEFESFKVNSLKFLFA